MYELIIDFGKRELLFSADIAAALDNPLEFNYLMNYRKKLFAISGELTLCSSNGKQRRGRLRKSRIEQYWDELDNLYHVPVGEIVLNKIGECIPDSKQNGAYLFHGAKDSTKNMIFFNLREK